MPGFPRWCYFIFGDQHVLPATQQKNKIQKNYLTVGSRLSQAHTNRAMDSSS